MNKREDAFSIFEDVIPSKQEPTIQVLYDYEKHYMDLVRRYKEEILFIENIVLLIQLKFLLKLLKKKHFIELKSMILKQENMMI